MIRKKIKATQSESLKLTRAASKQAYAFTKEYSAIGKKLSSLLVPHSSLRNEEKLRLNGLLSESKHSELAYRKLAPKTPLQSLLKQKCIKLSDINDRLTKEDKKRQSTISEVLRPHWKKAIDKQEETDVRDSFDEALTRLQLLELAVENGYVSVEATIRPAKKIILELLWSEGARKFIRDYDYLNVRFLAQRVGVELGPPDLSLPKINSKGDLHFAGFLAQWKSWEENSSIDSWIHLMDGYSPDDADYYEPDAFHKFITKGYFPKKSTLEDVERFLFLGSGMTQFIQSLSSLFQIMTKVERTSYGIFYSYWLARFFGYDKGKVGFYYDKNFERGFDWSSALNVKVLAAAVSDSYRSGLLNEPQKVKLLSNLRTMLQRDVNVLRGVWKQTRKALTRAESA